MKYQILTGYHDAILSSIGADDTAGSCSLVFELADGSVRRVVLERCELIRAVDFTKRNVVSRLLRYRGANVDVVDIAEKLNWATSFSDASSYLSREKRDSIISRVQGEAASIIYLEPSSGAELVALFSEMVEY